ncbi:MAG: glycosyltransferase family 4 protein, partial [Deltaproteobacteria bacterium]|nr:glycosyltransferase family 4 protein [Deltaproteobacteria bacterium]
MRIGIDISRTVGEQTGVGSYTASLVRGLADIDAENEYLLYPYFWECFSPNFRRVRVPQRPNFRLWAEDLPLEEIHRRWVTEEADRVIGGVDVVHSTAFTAPLLKKSRLVVTVHDTTFLTHPEFHSQANREFCLRNTHWAAKLATMIIVPSLSTKHDLLQHYPILEERIAVIPEAAAEDFYPVRDQTEVRRVLAKHGIFHNYLLFVGTIEPRKNLLTLIHAVADLLKNGQPRYLLVIAGASGWLNSHVYTLVQSLGLQDGVRFLGYVGAEELRALYSAARVFVYPSLYEGFGLPVLEAMACGAPVITANTSSLPEVAGEAAILAPPTDVGKLKQAIAAVLND